MTRVFVIAEAGVNHNGSEEMAMRLVDAASDAGADAVKFQTFQADLLASPSAPKARYQSENTTPKDSQLDMLRALELSFDSHCRVMEHCRGKGIKFLSTPFDEVSLDFLVDELGLDCIKISSGDLTNGPFLLRVARKNKTIILSTGMGSLGQVEDALAVLAYGMLCDAAPQGLRQILEILNRPEAWSILREKVTLLHCTTEYPAPADSANLSSMSTLSQAFGLPVGYSDHTIGSHVASAAVALGAVLIEKHITLDRQMEGPDHLASADPAQFCDYVRAVREVSSCMGSGRKVPSAAELDNRTAACRSLSAITNIQAGDLWCCDTLACRRPGSGLSPMLYWDYLGRRSERKYSCGELLDLSEGR